MGKPRGNRNIEDFLGGGGEFYGAYRIAKSDSE